MVLALLLVVPLAVGVWLSLRALEVSPLESAQQAEATVGVVEAAARTDQVSTSARYVAGDPLPVFSQSSGLVTEVAIEPGDPVAAGDVVMRVDGAPVTAYVSASPMYRDVGGDLTGDDVAIAQNLLRDLGYLQAAADGEAGPRTVAAIEEFNSDRGLGDDNGVLSLSSLLWIPDPSVAPASVSVTLGIRLEEGAEVYVTAATEPFVSVAIDASDQARLVEVADLTTELAAGATAIEAPDVVAAIARYQGEEPSVRATVVLAEPRQVGTVPATALVTDADGTVCFFTDLDGPAVVVEAADGSFGMVDVDTELVDTPALLNPRDVREDLACG